MKAIATIRVNSVVLFAYNGKYRNGTVKAIVEDSATLSDKRSEPYITVEIIKDGSVRNFTIAKIEDMELISL